MGGNTKLSLVVKPELTFEAYDRKSEHDRRFCMRVLLVEDDPTTSKSIELILTHAKLNVYATDLGEEGIDLAKLYDYDLILLDLNLPDMNGHEVLRQLLLSRIESPILILSGDDDTESKLKGFGFGADDYLTKPFHREELVARIHAIIRRSKGHA